MFPGSTRRSNPRTGPAPLGRRARPRADPWFGHENTSSDVVISARRFLDRIDCSSLMAADFVRRGVYKCVHRRGRTVNTGTLAASGQKLDGYPPAKTNGLKREGGRRWGPGCCRSGWVAPRGKDGAHPGLDLAGGQANLGQTNLATALDTFVGVYFCVITRGQHSNGSRNSGLSVSGCAPGGADYEACGSEDLGRPAGPDPGPPLRYGLTAPGG